MFYYLDKVIYNPRPHINNQYEQYRNHEAVVLDYFSWNDLYIIRFKDRTQISTDANNLLRVIERDMEINLEIKDLFN